MQASDRLSMLSLSCQCLHDKLTYAEPVIADSVIVSAQIADNNV